MAAQETMKLADSVESPFDKNAFLGNSAPGQSGWDFTDFAAFLRRADSDWLTERIGTASSTKIKSTQS